GGEHRGRMTEQGQVVGVVAGHAPTALLQVVDQEAQVEDVGLVEKDVVLESSFEGEDVVVRDRTRAEDHRTSTKASGNRKGAPDTGRPLCSSLVRRRGVGMRAGGPACARPGAAASGRSPARAGSRSGRWS